MRSKDLSLRLTVFLAIVAMASLLTATSAAAQEIWKLHSFLTNGRDGTAPPAELIFGASGDLYGTTSLGGTYNSGTVFELLPNSTGGGTEKILHSFSNNLIDGNDPGGGLTFDSKGNIYGTTYKGGSGGCTAAGVVIGCGTVFELTPQSNGSYTEQVIYTFQARGGDGTFPVCTLIFDSAGNLYGTAQSGGTYGHGTVFELSPTTGGTWTEKILWSFHKTDGQNPRAGLILDSAGNLYGATFEGGAYTSGTVYELSPSSGGTWTETVLHSFTLGSTDVANPAAKLIFDAAGNLYGTASYGNLSGAGGVFELSPASGGTWTEKVVYFFAWPTSSDGYDSFSPLIFDASGNLYGTTTSGGAGQCQQIGLVIGCGTIFRLTQSSSGTWTETLRYSFQFASNGGPEGPFNAGLIADSSGKLYGTTVGGGKDSAGMVFEFKP
jgi:uncharacterized repeat protein (TIGR03803 family)